MKILVAEDAESALLLMVRFVEALGHQAIPASDGGAAVAAWRQESPDLVLMDIMMPVMSGPQAAAIIKDEAGETWVPIVFITGVGEENLLAEAIERCADDYLSKPVSFRVLGAKLKAFERTLELNKKVRDQSERLANYYDRSEEEKRVVRHLMDQLISAERLNDPAIRYWLAPAESLSGDLIAAARTPGDVLHVLLADGIGHGLSAALNVLPLTQPFYGMTEKGHALPAILAEMNDKIRQVLPVGRFVAVTMIAINEADRCIEIWNGGMPDQKILNESGLVIDACKSFSLPLGIVASDLMDFTPQRFGFDGPGSVLAYSDGLIEARNAQGRAFDLRCVLDVMQGSPFDERIDAVRHALIAHTSDAGFHDDVSLLLARFGGVRNALVPGREPQSGKLDWREAERCVDAGEVLWRYDLVLGEEALRQIHVVPFVMEFIDGLRSLQSCVSDVFRILDALFGNALDYGVLGMPPRPAVEAPRWLASKREERVRRQTCLTGGQIEIDLAGVDCGGVSVVRIRVKDSGPGFDWRPYLSDPDDQMPPHGSGIRLVRSLCAELRYREYGSEAIAYYVPA